MKTAIYSQAKLITILLDDYFYHIHTIRSKDLQLSSFGEDLCLLSAYILPDMDPLFLIYSTIFYCPLHLALAITHTIPLKFYSSDHFSQYCYFFFDNGSKFTAFSAESQLISTFFSLIISLNPDLKDFSHFCFFMFCSTQSSFCLWLFLFTGHLF